MWNGKGCRLGGVSEICAHLQLPEFRRGGLGYNVLNPLRRNAVPRQKRRSRGEYLIDSDEYGSSRGLETFVNVLDYNFWKAQRGETNAVEAEVLVLLSRRKTSASTQ